MLVLDFIFCVSLEVCEDLLVFRCVIGKTFMGLRKISHAIEAYQGLGVDKDLVLRFGRWLHPKYLKKIRRRVRFSYVFTRSSLNVIDMSFSLYYDFFYKSLSDYFNKQDKRIYVFIASKKAVAGPPLGSLLAQYDIRVAEFCTRFNKRTEFLSSDIIVRVIID